MAFLAPFALAAIMGFAFGSGDSTAQIRVAVADVENTAVTQAFVDEILRSLSLGPGVAIVRTTDLVRAANLYEAGRVSGMIGLAPGSTARILRGELPSFAIQSSRTRPLGKAVVDAFYAGASLRQATTYVVARAVGGPYAGPDAQRVGRAAAAAPPVVRVADDRVPARGSLLGYYAPAMAVVFLFLSVGASANSVLGERRTGTMARLQAAPTGLGAVVAGKTASIVLLMLLSVGSLWGATSLAFGAQWGPATGVIPLTVATVGAIGAVGLFVTVAARTEATAQVATAAVAFVLALLGGNFFPPGSLPPLLERLALLTPNGWALDGFTTLSLDGGGLGDVVRPIVVLSAISVTLGAIAVTRFKRAMAAT
jgi:ABC-2 type transport system permease protein